METYTETVQSHPLPCNPDLFATQNIILPFKPTYRKSFIHCFFYLVFAHLFLDVLKLIIIIIIITAEVCLY
jgi:hypothetical protein